MKERMKEDKIKREIKKLTVKEREEEMKKKGQAKIRIRIKNMNGKINT